jgi:hypothetical protein
MMFIVGRGDFFFSRYTTSLDNVPDQYDFNPDTKTLEM